MKKAAVFLFFAAIAGLGLFIYKDFGISWDETIQHKYGEDTYNYIFKKDNHLLKNKDRYYGPVIELLLISVEKALTLTDPRDVYLTRHLFTFGIFFVGAVFMYFLGVRLFKKPILGFLATTMLIISPRIFGHAFYNSKDIPVLTFFIICIYTLSNFREHPSAKTTLLHALTTALLIDIRIVGILIPALTIISALKKFKTIKLLGLYLIASALLIISFWPTLWTRPIQNFEAAIKQMSQYPQQTATFTFGKNLKSTKLPWWYAPAWIGITTPISYLILFILGLNPISTKKLSNWFIVYCWAFLPILAIILFKSTLYNGWRQLFFVYPAIILIAVHGLDTLTHKKILLYGAVAAVLIDMGLTTYTMAKIHPYESLYFNRLAGARDKLAKNFELDYWGISYKEGLEYIAATDPRTQITVKVKNLPGINNALLLLPQDRNRILVSENMENPDYYLTTYRKGIQEGKADFSVKVFGNEILGIYKLTNPTPASSASEQ